MLFYLSVSSLTLPSLCAVAVPLSHRRSEGGGAGLAGPKRCSRLDSGCAISLVPPSLWCRHLFGCAISLLPPSLFWLPRTGPRVGGGSAGGPVWPRENDVSAETTCQERTHDTHTTRHTHTRHTRTTHNTQTHTDTDTDTTHNTTHDTRHDTRHTTRHTTYTHADSLNTLRRHHEGEGRRRRSARGSGQQSAVTPHMCTQGYIELTDGNALHAFQKVAGQVEEYIKSACRFNFVCKRQGER